MNESGLREVVKNGMERHVSSVVDRAEELVSLLRANAVASSGHLSSQDARASWEELTNLASRVGLQHFRRVRSVRGGYQLTQRGALAALEQVTGVAQEALVRHVSGAETGVLDAVRAAVGEMIGASFSSDPTLVRGRADSLVMAADARLRRSDSSYVSGSTAHKEAILHLLAGHDPAGGDAATSLDERDLARLRRRGVLRAVEELGCVLASSSETVSLTAPNGDDRSYEDTLSSSSNVELSALDAAGRSLGSIEELLDAAHHLAAGAATLSAPAHGGVMQSADDTTQEFLCSAVIQYAFSTSLNAGQISRCADTTQDHRDLIDELALTL
jgi:hypothetical protein